MGMFILEACDKWLLWKMKNDARFHWDAKKCEELFFHNDLPPQSSVVSTSPIAASCFCRKRKIPMELIETEEEKLQERRQAHPRCPLSSTLWPVRLVHAVTVVSPLNWWNGLGILLLEVCAGALPPRKDRGKPRWVQRLIEDNVPNLCSVCRALVTSAAGNGGRM